MSERTAVYRLYDEADALLYVGASRDPDYRFKNHAGISPWWPLVRRTAVEWHATRPDAETAEDAAIDDEHPRYNRTSTATLMNVTRDFGEIDQMGIACLRNRLADVVHASAAHNRITYITSRGRRVAAVVPLAVAEDQDHATKEADDAI